MLNNRMFYSIACWLVALMLLGTASLKPIKAQDNQWSVASREVLPFAGGWAYLAPDGEHVLHTSSGQLCVYTTKGEQQTCIDLEEKANPHSVDQFSVQWSPNSQYVAFTENFYQFLVDSDIWLLEVATSKLTNLTDDGITKFNFRSDNSKENGAIDVVPRWSLDSQRLYFLRCEQPCQGADQFAVLYSADIASASLEKIAELKTSIVFTYGMALASDGQHIAYFLTINSKGEPMNGLYMMDIEGQHSQQLLQVDQMYSVQFSADDHYLLGFSPLVEMKMNSSTEKVLHRIVDLESGKEIAITASTVNPLWPSWGPTGAMLAFIVRNPKDPTSSGLYVSDQPNSAAQLVYQSDKLASSAVTRGVQWAPNNVVLVAEGGQFIILHLIHS